jgi:hypothetical protein
MQNFSAFLISIAIFWRWSKKQTKKETVSSSQAFKKLHNHLFFPLGQNRVEKTKKALSSIQAKCLI